MVARGVSGTVLVEYRGGVDPSRRITLAVGLSMFVDAALYLAVIPLLPHYVDRFGLSSLQAGAVVAAYPISVPIVSIGCIALVPRFGAKRISVVSAALMTVSTRDLRLGAQRARAGARPVRAGPRVRHDLDRVDGMGHRQRAARPPRPRVGDRDGHAVRRLGRRPGGRRARQLGRPGHRLRPGRRRQPGRAGDGGGRAGRTHRRPPGADPLRAAPRLPRSGRPWRPCR